MQTSSATDRQKFWDLIKNEHTAVLVTVDQDGALVARPMGCVQKEFDGTLWFITFKDSPKLLDIETNQHCLVSYSRPSDYEFVSVSGSARIVHDHAKTHSLWSEALRVWFPDGPDSPDIALVAVEVDEEKAWTKPASTLTYAYYYLRARLTGKAPSPKQIGQIETMRPR